MSPDVIVAVIGAVGLIGAQIVIAKSNNKSVLQKIEEQSKLADKELDAKLEKWQAVTDTKIDELTREVREHNNFAKRVPVLEEKVANLERKAS